MIGNGYWSTGIVVRYGYSGMNLYGWGARIDFFDGGFCNGDTAGGIIPISTEGTLRTRYFVREGDGPDADSLTAAVDAIKRDAEQLGITFTGPASGSPFVYYEGDGEDEDWPPPDGWREMVNAQARRLGWEPLYRERESA